VQAFDRYLYAGNNPVNFNDPSGHLMCSSDEPGVCRDRVQVWMITTAAQYGVSFAGDWKVREKVVAILGVMAVGDKLSQFYPGSSSSSAFRSVYSNGIHYVWDPRCNGCRTGVKLNPDGSHMKVVGKDKKDHDVPCGADFTSYGCVAAGGVTSGNTITFASMSGEAIDDQDMMEKNVIHELGHAYANAVGGTLPSGLSRAALISDIPGRYDWQQHPPSMNVDNQEIGGELFADTFVAWTLNGWNTSTDINVVNAVTNAQNAMDGYVP
jgi:hypothetical protein